MRTYISVWIPTLLLSICSHIYAQEGALHESDAREVATQDKSMHWFDGTVSTTSIDQRIVVPYVDNLSGVSVEPHSLQSRWADDLGLVIVNTSDKSWLRGDWRDKVNASNSAELVAEFTRFNDDDLQFILDSGVKLTYVGIGSTFVTDCGIEMLSTCPSIVALDVSGLNLSNDALDSIAKLQSLELLSLGGVTLDSQVLAACIEKLPKLRFLYLHRAERGSAVWKAVAQLKRLDVLDVGNSDFDDDALKSLTGSSITKLIAHETELTDDCLDWLLKMNALQELTLSHLDHSYEFRVKLRKAKPDLCVNFEGFAVQTNCGSNSIDYEFGDNFSTLKGGGFSSSADNSSSLFQGGNFSRSGSGNSSSKNNADNPEP